MKRRRQYTRDFKIGVIREVKMGKTLAQVSRENEIHPSLVVKWKKEYFRDPENAFRGNGNGRAYKEQARMTELERLVYRSPIDFEKEKEREMERGVKASKVLNTIS